MLQKKEDNKLNNNTDKCRAEFEKKWESKPSLVPLDKNAAGEYICIVTAVVWASWQTAYNLNPPAGHNEVGEDVVERVANALIRVKLKLDDAPQGREYGYLNSLIWDDSTRDLARAAIAAMPGKEAALRDGWRPIESAPKDGYILLTEGSFIVMGAWDRGRQKWQRYLPEYFGKDNEYFSEKMLFTHWMQLPKPPTAGEK